MAACVYKEFIAPKYITNCCIQKVSTILSRGYDKNVYVGKNIGIWSDGIQASMRLLCWVVGRPL